MKGELFLPLIYCVQPMMKQEPKTECNTISTMFYFYLDKIRDTFIKAILSQCLVSVSVIG